jgi:hypothetical protein
MERQKKIFKVALLSAWAAALGEEVSSPSAWAAALGEEGFFPECCTRGRKFLKEK